MTQKVEEAVQEIEDELDQEVRKVKESNGFLTKTGAWIDKTEWHSVAISAAWASLPFAFPTPFDAMFLISFAFFVREVVKGRAFPDSQLGDPANQFAYSLPTYAVVSWMFIVLTDFSVESIDVGAALLQAIVGA